MTRFETYCAQKQQQQALHTPQESTMKRIAYINCTMQHNTIVFATDGTRYRVVWALSAGAVPLAEVFRAADIPNAYQGEVFLVELAGQAYTATEALVYR